MFSAYDIKKILPRAVFALVGISLSWALMNILVNFMGFLGDSIEKIILDSFTTASSRLTSIQLDGASEGWFMALASVAVVGTILGLLPVLGLAIAGATGVGLAFIIILLRRVALVALVISAPLAIAMSVLPQTEKVFKEWWEWFFKLLLMYPFLMAMFAFSRVAAGLFSLTGEGAATNVLYQFAAIAILIAPYFLVGKAFSFAGGSIAKLAGVVNNKDRGIIDKTKKWEAGKVAERRIDAKAGSRYGGRNVFTRGLNRGLRAVSNPRSVIGAQEDRDARVMAAVQQNAGSMETRHDGAKSLTKEEIQLLAGISDESQAKERIAYLAAQRARENGTDEAYERALLNASFRSAKQKVGGSVDTSSQYYALQRAAAEGALSPANLATAAQELSGKLATAGSQQGRLEDTILTQLDGMAAAAGAMPASVSRAASAARGAGGPPAGPDHQMVEDTFRGASALGFDKLGSMKSGEFTHISASKSAQTSDALGQLNVSTNPAQSRQQVDALIRHRADLIVTRKAAIKANNAQLVNDSMAALDAVDEQIRNAQAAGGVNAPDFDYIQQQSQTQADDRIKT